MTTGVPPLDGGERLLEIDAACGATRRRRPGASSRPSRSARASSRLSMCRSFADGTFTTRTARPAPRRSSSTSGWRRDSSLERIRSEGGSASRNGNRRRAGPRTSGARSSASAGGFCTARLWTCYLNAVVYIPYRQESPAAASLLVRSALPPGSVMDAVRREVQAIDRDQPVYTIQTLEQLLAAGPLAVPHLGRHVRDSSPSSRSCCRRSASMRSWRIR